MNMQQNQMQQYPRQWIQISPLHCLVLWAIFLSYWVKPRDRSDSFHIKTLQRRAWHIYVFFSRLIILQLQTPADSL